ncbi:MAG: nucleotidyltransferase family protein [Elusimicrobiota bacterium]
MKTLNEAKQIIKKNKPMLKSKYGVKEIGIFGSFVRGEARKRSDIDILVNFSRPIGFEFISLGFYLKKILHRKIDLVTERALKMQLKDKILKEVLFI